MKCFLKGLAGALFGLLLLAIIYPLYSDYRSFSETYNWIQTVAPLKAAIESNAVKRKSLIGSGKNIDLSPFRWKNMSYFDVSADGIITIKGGRDGQVVILTPSFAAEKIVWHCIGGPTNAMPPACK